MWGCQAVTEGHSHQSLPGTAASWPLSLASQRARGLAQQCTRTVRVLPRCPIPTAARWGAHKDNLWSLWYIAVLRLGGGAQKQQQLHHSHGAAVLLPGQHSAAVLPKVTSRCLMQQLLWFRASEEAELYGVPSCPGAQGCCSVRLLSESCSRGAALLAAICSPGLGVGAGLAVVLWSAHPAPGS